MTARTAAKAFSILVVSDSTAENAVVHGLLEPEFGEADMLVVQDVAKPDARMLEPGIIILAFRQLDTAARCARQLRTGGEDAARQRRIIVLCDKADYRRAFDLAREGIFDDYVVFWPMQHDGLRILMSVHVARRSLAAGWAAGVTLSDIAAEARQLGQLDTLISESLDQADASISVAGDLIADAQQQIGGVFRGLVDLLSSAEMDELVGAKSPRDVGQVLERAYTEQVQPVLDDVRNKLAPMGQWVSNFRQDLQPHVARVRTLAAAARKYKPVVLVVDDNELLRSTIRNMMVPNNYSVLQADGGLCAIDILHQQEVDVILMDMIMPGMDGLQTIARIRAVERFKSIPVIILTGKSDPVAVRDSLAAGARDFIVKPFKIPMLLAKIDMVLGR